MYLTSLHLNYFRSYITCKLNLTEQPVVIFGNNGAGKTNILEAVSLLTPGRGLRRAITADFSRKPDNLGWKISASLSQGNIIQTGVNLQQSPQRTVFIDDTPARVRDFSQHLRIIWLTPAMDRLWTEDPAGRRRFLDRMTLSFFPSHAQNSAIYEKALRARNILLREPNLDARWCATLEADMAKAAEAIKDARNQTIVLLEKAQTDSPTAFPIADLTINDPTPDNLQDFWAQTRAHDHRAGRTLLGPHKADLQAVYKIKSMPAATCSTGEQKALLMSIVLANARALIDYSTIKPLVLLDEVAAHFDPVRRDELFDEICHLNVQAWMTGTEEVMFNGMRSRGQLIRISDNNGHSTVISS